MKIGLASRLLGLELQPPSSPAGASPEEDAEEVGDVAPDDDAPAEPLELLVPLVPLAPLVPDDEAEPEDEDADAPDASAEPSAVVQ